MILRLPAISGNGSQIPLHRGRQLCLLIAIAVGLLHLLHAVVRIQARLDAFRQRHLLLRIEQRNLADLLEVGTHRIRRRGKLRILPSLPQRSRLVLIPHRGTIFIFLVHGWHGVVIVAEVRIYDRILIILIAVHIGIAQPIGQIKVGIRLQQ